MSDVKRWRHVSVLLIAAGTLLLCGSIAHQSTLVVVDEYIEVTEGGTRFGAFPLETGEYTVWVEDRYPEVDGTNYFVVWAQDYSLNHEDGRDSTNQTTRRIRGVDCEEAATFERLDEGDWAFTIVTNMYGEEDGAVRVFITRENDPIPAYLWSGAILCLTFGVFTLLASWGARKQHVGHTT